MELLYEEILEDELQLNILQRQYEEVDALLGRVESLRDAVEEYGISRSVMVTVDPAGELLDYVDLPSYDSLPIGPEKGEASDAALEGLGDAIKRIWEAIADFCKKMWNGFKNLIKKIFGVNDAGCSKLEKTTKEIDETWKSIDATLERIVLMEWATSLHFDDAIPALKDPDIMKYITSTYKWMSEASKVLLDGAMKDPSKPLPAAAKSLLKPSDAEQKLVGNKNLSKYHGVDFVKQTTSRTSKVEFIAQNAKGGRIKRMPITMDSAGLKRISDVEKLQKTLDGMVKDNDWKRLGSWIEDVAVELAADAIKDAAKKATGADAEALKERDALVKAYRRQSSNFSKIVAGRSALLKDAIASANNCNKAILKQTEKAKKKKK